MIAEIIIDSKAKKLNRKFDYKIPKNLEDILSVGSRVLVPFGNFKALEQGYIINIKETTDFEVKEIAGLEENLPEDRINLARWMSRKYFANVSDCINLMLTPGTKSKNKEERIDDKTLGFVYLNKKIEEIEKIKLRGEKQKRLLEFLKNNEGFTITEIENINEVSRATIKSLEEKEIIKIVNKKIDRNPLINKNINHDKKMELTEEQKNAYNKVKKTIEEKRFEEFLLYGVTGSRKNRSIYAVNRRDNKKERICNNVSSRNFFNTPNDR